MLLSRPLLSLLLMTMAATSLFAEEEKTFSGTVVVKQDDAPGEVVAVLKEKKKKGEAQRVWNLYAGGNVAKALKKFASDKTKVVLSGIEVNGGVKVSAISDPERVDEKAAVKETSGTLSDLFNRARTAVEDAGGGKSIGDMVLSNDEIRAGLREALAKGIKAAIAELGRVDGYFKNADVHIPVPDELQKVEEGLRLIKKDKLVDDFILSMNRAAEQAVPDVVDIFADAIASMSIEDAKSILRGEKDAATQYFKKTSETKLVERITPIVKKATDSVGVTANYKKVMGKAGFVAQLLKKDEMDLDAYVTKKGLDGLFFMIAKEEKNIRENPAARTTDVLRKIFGAVEKK